jgi:SAM-dependent MidA family methyltransferase
MGRPSPLRLIELGAGDGTLGERVVKNLPAAAVAHYAAVEQSALARSAVRSRGLFAAAGLEDLDSGQIARATPTCVLANELLDNLPFHRIRADAAGAVHEVRIGADANSFIEVEVPCPPELHRTLDPGRELTVPVKAYELVERLAEVVRNGYVLIIDYGSSADGEPAGDVHGYRNQRLVEDILNAPGTADITAGVDFTSIAEHATGAGFHPFPLTSQRDALIRLGFDRWNEAERARQASLLDGGSGADAVRAWGSRNEAGLLVDPRGLGRLQWLLLATPGLPAPEWIAGSPEAPGKSESKGGSS